MLPFWCFWPASDLFLIFPGIFFNFKKISTGSQTKNTINNNQSKIITNTRNTVLVLVLVLVVVVLVLVLVVVVVIEVVEVVIVIEVAMIRDEVDGWMDGC